MTWLIDQTNVLTFLLATAALGCVVYGWLTTRAKYWFWAAGFVAAIALLWLLGQFVVTDRRQIILNLDRMAQASVQQKPDVLFRYLARDFKFGSLGRDELHQRISRQVQVHKVHGVHLWDQRVKVEGTQGEVVFNFRADAEDDKKFIASAKAKFVKEDGTWKMKSVEVYSIGSTQRLHVPGVD